MMRWLVLISLVMFVVRAQASETASVPVETRIVPRPVSVVISSPQGVLNALQTRQKSVATLSKTSADCQIVVVEVPVAPPSGGILEHGAAPPARQLFITLHNR